MAGEHDGHRKRMRERFMEQGLAGFAPHEMLELILFYGIPRANVNPLAHRLMDTFGSLHGVLEADAKDLARVEGIGESTAQKIVRYIQFAEPKNLRKSVLTTTTVNTPKA